MEKTKVIFRKEEDGNIIAFLPECTVNFGNIGYLSRTDEHGEASVLYYRNCTKHAKESEYAGFLRWMENAYDYNVMPCKRLNWNELRKEWR